MKKLFMTQLILFCSLLFLTPPPSLVAEEPPTYTIRRGDTLWDITDHFFNDPWLWPNLWKNNPYITNPHLIFPGNKLKLFIGEKRPIAIPELQVKPPVIPSREAEPEPKETQVETFTYAKMDTIGFISKEKLKEKGTIQSLPRSKDLLSKDDIVYLNSHDKEPLPEGSTWTIYRAPDIVYHPLTDKKMGYYYLPLGTLKIIKAGHPATGKIRYSFQTISIGDQIMPLEDISSQLQLKECSSNITATIIKTEPPVEEIAQYQIVYLDKGKKAGIGPGNCLEVFRTKEVLGSKQIIPLGKILVLRAQAETSTALVIKSKESFPVGTKVRTKTP